MRKTITAIVLTVTLLLTARNTEAANPSTVREYYMEMNTSLRQLEAATAEMYRVTSDVILYNSITDADVDYLVGLAQDHQVVTARLKELTKVRTYDNKLDKRCRWAASRACLKYEKAAAELGKLDTYYDPWVGVSNMEFWLGEARKEVLVFCKYY